MQEAEPPGTVGPSSYPPADFRRRALARFIDLLVALAPIFLVPRGHSRAALALSAALILCNDSLFGAGQSLGKRVAGLRVLVLATRRAGQVRDSFVRNSLFLFGVVPVALGLPVHLSAAALFAIGALEAAVALRPLTRDLGQRRVGDLLAGTQVIDASLALGLPLLVRPDAPRAQAPFASRAARAERDPLSTRQQPGACRPLQHLQDTRCA